MGSWEHKRTPGEDFFTRIHVCNFHTGILQCVVKNILIKITHRFSRKSRFFRFSKLFFKHFFFSFTMVIKRFRELRGESAFGDRSASTMSKWAPAWTLTSEMVPFGSKSVTLSMSVDRCGWRSTWLWSHQLTSDLKRCLLFWKCLQWLFLKAVLVPTFVIGGLRGSTATSGSCYGEHQYGVERCELWKRKGSCNGKIRT